MASPTRRPESRHLQFRKKVPADLRDVAKGKHVFAELPPIAGQDGVLVAIKISGQEVKLSLRTSDKGAARLRNAAANVAVERAFTAMRAGPAPLTQKQVVALAGDVYRSYIARWEDEPGSPERWACFKSFNRAIAEGRIGAAPAATFADAGDIEDAVKRFGKNLTRGIDLLDPSDPTEMAMEARFGFLADFALMRYGLTVDAASRTRLLHEVAKAATDAGWALKRAAQGDYSPDPKAARFPSFEMTRAGVTLTALFEAWAHETNPSASTRATWRGCFRLLREHLGHDDATRLTEDDLIAWKDALLAGGRAARTVKDNHLTAVRSVLAHALRNRKISVNVASNIRIAVKAVAGQSRQPYTTEEVARLLDLASRETKPSLRWLPLLAAATGARIGEVAQLHGSHVVETDGVPCIRIEPTNDGGTIKNVASERTVPIHADVLKAGFLELVRARGQGPLFYQRTSGDPARMHASKGVSNRIRLWVREKGFTDPRKSPLHSFRHWWKTEAARVGVQDSVADAVQGHAARTVAGVYRHFDLPTLAKAVAAIRLPR